MLEVNESNYMDFRDLEYYNQQYFASNFFNYPIYIDKILKNPNDVRISSINFHK